MFFLSLRLLNTDPEALLLSPGALLAGKAPIYLQSVCFNAVLQEPSAGHQAGFILPPGSQCAGPTSPLALSQLSAVGFAWDCPFLRVWKGQEPTFISTWASCSTLSSFDASE